MGRAFMWYAPVDTPVVGLASAVPFPGVALGGVAVVVDPTSVVLAVAFVARAGAGALAASSAHTDSRFASQDCAC